MELKTIFAGVAMVLLLSVDSFAVSTDTWGGTGGNSNFSTSGNWSFSSGSGPVASGDALVFDTSGTSSTTLTSINDDDSGYTFSSLTFNGNLTGPLTMGGDAFTLTGGIVNSNTTSGRNVTINNAITISGSQTWTASSNSGITILGGALSDSSTSDTISISGNPGSNSTNLPTFQLTGNNSNYDGTINFVASASGGILLGSAAAMTSGLIDTTTGNHNTLWLTANTSGSPYTFGIYGTGTGALVKMADGGGDGLFLTANNSGAGGGSIYWDPGAGSNYNWSAGSVTNEDTIVVGGSNDTNPDTLYLGNSSSQFIISGASKTFKIYSVGNNPGYVTLQSALADGNESTSRTLTTSLNLLTLTQAAVNNSSTHPLSLTVTEVGAYLPGSVSISAANQLPGGNLNLNGGVLILNGVTWDQFAATRTNATSGNNTYQLTQNTSNSVTTPGGFASTGNITIDGNSTSSSTFSGGFILGSNAVTSTGAEYATGSINLAQNINFSAAENLIFGGNSSVSTAGVYTLGSQTMTLSGNLVGTGSPTLTIAGLNTNGVAGTLVPVVLLSGNNSGLNLSTSNGGGSGFGALVANSDAAFGGGTLTINSATPSGKSNGWLALLSGSYTSSKTISFTSSAGVTAASWGLGSYTGNDVYAGTSTINVSNAASEVIPFNLDAESGSTFALGVTSGTAATFTNNSATGNTIQYRKTGGGTVIINNAIYNGTDTNAVQFNVLSGSLLVENSTGSALGAGPLTVAAGATFGGSGSATGLSGFVIGSGTSSRAQVQVGLGGTDTTSTLTLQAATGTLTYANLSFNLSNTGTGNQLVLNNSGATGTTLTLGTGTSASTLTLNVVGGTIAPNTSFVLMTDATAFTGLTTVNGGSDAGSSTSDVITGGLSIAPNSYFGASIAGVASGPYGGSYLYLTDNGTQIDVMVVPEPGTWAMMFGGLVLLLLVQRARRDKDV